MAKKPSYEPTSRPAPRVVNGRTFQLAAPMQKGGQQAKAAPKSRTT